MSNLLKYALGLMPMTPAADAAPAFVVENDGRIAVELERSTDADVTFHLEASTDLEDWNNIAFNEEVIDPEAGDDRERIRMVSDLAASDTSRRFLRLLIRME